MAVPLLTRPAAEPRYAPFAEARTDRDRYAMPEELGFRLHMRVTTRGRHIHGSSEEVSPVEYLKWDFRRLAPDAHDRRWSTTGGSDDYQTGWSRNTGFVVWVEVGYKTYNSDGQSQETLIPTTGESEETPCGA